MLTHDKPGASEPLYHVSDTDMTSDQGNMMSLNTEHTYAIPETAIAFLLEDDNGDRLTDILVDALDEAFRILSEEIGGPTMN